MVNFFIIILKLDRMGILEFYFFAYYLSHGLFISWTIYLMDYLSHGQFISWEKDCRYNHKVYMVFSNYSQKEKY